MSNWCMGCGKEIPDGDYCTRCKEQVKAMSQYREEKDQDPTTPPEEGTWDEDGNYYPSQAEVDAMEAEIRDAELYDIWCAPQPTEQPEMTEFEAQLSDAMDAALKEDEYMPEAPPYYDDSDIPF